ncbi:MAG: imidazole glycerol phosphate synthase subunit HisH [Clostridia bacterium]
MTGIIDYGMGNLGSVANALKYISTDFFITQEPGELDKADRIILPGVGAFEKAMDHLRETGMAHAAISQIRKGKPFLGICLGLQMLFSYSEEGIKTDGLSVLPGRVVKFKEYPGLKVPHMGWNAIKTEDASGFFHEYNGCYVYFVHSFHALPEEGHMLATRTSYGEFFASAVEKDNVLACQFHPEKSGRTGIDMLRKWVDAG